MNWKTVKDEKGFTWPGGRGEFPFREKSLMQESKSLVRGGGE